MCVFARHKRGAGPRPSHGSISSSCCNVLIYLGAVLQRKVLSILHYSLKPAGFLILGPSESIGSTSDQFRQVESTHKIYRSAVETGKSTLPLTEGGGADGRVDLPEENRGEPPRDGCRERSRPAGAGGIRPLRSHR